MEIGKYNLCIMAYEKLFRRHKVWLVGMTFVISFLIPFIISAITNKLLSDDRQGYLQDFPATFSIGVGLPILALFLAHYSERVPKVLTAIVSEDTIRIDKKKYEGILARFERKFNSKWSIMFFIPAAGLQLLWVTTFLNRPPVNWFSYASSSGFESLNAGGFYYVFLCALYLYLVLYIILYFVLMTVLLWTIAGNAEVKVRPLHPDDCGGLSKIGSLGLLVSYPIILFGIGIAAIFYGDIYIHGQPAFSLLTHYLIVITYFIVAPLLFFLPLYTFRAPMKRAKSRSLAYFSELFETEYQRLPAQIDTNSSNNTLEILTRLETINASYDIAKKMPIWPFNLQLLEQFSFIIVSPVLVIIVPLILDKYL